MKSLLPALALAGLLSLVLEPFATLPAWAEGCLDMVRTRGELVVGMSPDFPPFEYLEPGKNAPVGFDVDLATMIAKDMDLGVKFVSQRFSALSDGLGAKSYDMIASAMTITDERRKNLDFSLPYIAGPNAIIVRKELKDINGINGLSDLSGRKVAVLQGSPLEKVARSVAGAEVKPVRQYSDAVNMVLTKQVQAMMAHKVVARTFLEKYSDLAIAAEMEPALGMGFAFRKDCPDLRSKVDAALEKLQKSGKIAELVAKWFK